MSLQKTFTFTNNCDEVANCVFVTTIGDKAEGLFTATIQEANEANNKALITVLFASPTINYVINYSFIPSGTNDLTTQGYEYLQTLPEFFGSIVV
jgi:hypothetical protein